MIAVGFFKRAVVMVISNTQTSKTWPKPSTVDRITDAVRHTAHLRHEARLMRSLARDAAEDGVHAARRAIRRGVGAMHDAQDETAYYVKRQPFKALALAFGAGLQIGALIAWFGRRGRGRTPARDKANG